MEEVEPGISDFLPSAFVSYLVDDPDRAKVLLTRRVCQYSLGSVKVGSLDTRDAHLVAELVQRLHLNKLKLVQHQSQNVPSTIAVLESSIHVRPRLNLLHFINY